MTRVVITGVGCRTAIGGSYREFSQSLLAGISGIRSTPALEAAGISPSYAASVAETRKPLSVEQRLWESLDLNAQFGLAAAVEAIDQSGLRDDDLLNDPETAVIFGCALGGAMTTESAYKEFFEARARRLAPLTVPRIMSSGVVSAIVMHNAMAGPAFAVSGACASSAQAIAIAKQMIQAGTIRRAVVGGTDASIAPGSWIAWQSLRVMSPAPCQPFAHERAGMTIGEGAAALVIETEEDAVRRGAEPLCRLSGAGMASSSTHITRPDIDGPAAAICRTLRDAGIKPRDVRHVNAHGTGTRTNDAIETKVLKRVFATEAYQLKISATKALHGHTLAAAGAVEALAAIIALREQKAPRTANFGTPDPECDLDYVTRQTVEWEGDHVLSNSFGFGGLNCCLLFSKP